ncbi:MAG: IS5 family transposase [Cytophagales bacterium]|nr:MAG: IS5 family transposase [Cytophagales bacterium]TAF59562.1 MAG: IS5 family transposase [Cytophagales bacterium]
MSYSLANITKDESNQFVLPLIPKNKRGFASRFSVSDLFSCMLHKLKTGCQWHKLFIDLEGFKPHFSWQSVYCFYKKWCQADVFKNLYNAHLAAKAKLLDKSNLNLDGTQTLVKKSAESARYQNRKKGRTSNVLIMTDAAGIPISIGPIIAGNHHDLYQVVPQFAAMSRQLNELGISVKGVMLNTDKGFDCKALRRAILRRGMIPNIKENVRNRKKTKRGKKRLFDQDAYKNRFVNERCFAWLDSFRTLLIRFDKHDSKWLNWHYIAAFLILLKV